MKKRYAIVILPAMILIVVSVMNILFGITKIKTNFNLDVISGIIFSCVLVVISVYALILGTITYFSGRPAVFHSLSDATPFSLKLIEKIKEKNLYLVVLKGKLFFVEDRKNYENGNYIKNKNGNLEKIN